MGKRLSSSITKRCFVIIKNVCLIIFSVVFAFSLVELGSFLLIKFDNKASSLYLHRLGKPTPYIDADYFSEEFIKESFSQPGGWLTPDNTRIVLPENYEGKYFKVVNNERYTPNSINAESAPTVFFFGGSTVYCSEVPDQYTMPNYFAKILKLKGIEYNVRNLGATSTKTSQQLERLRNIKIKKGDIVIFYDGVNDIFQSIYFNNPECWIVGDNRERLIKSDYFERFFVVKNKLISSSNTFNYLKKLAIKKNLPEHFEDENNINKLLEVMDKNYYSEHIEASSYSRSAGADFFHFLQPALFSKKGFSEYEESLIDNEYIVYPGVEMAMKAGYSMLRNTIKRLNEYGISAYDISDTFDNFNKDIYLDSCHLNHEGNELVAENIFYHINKKMSVLCKNKYEWKSYNFEN